MTYRLQMAGERRRMEREHQERMSMAWHVAALPRMKSFPTLASLTGVKPKVRKQSAAEVKAMFAAMRESRS